MTFQLEQLSLVFTDCMGSCSLYDVNLDVILAAAQLSLVPVFSQHSYGQPSQDSVKYPILFQWIPLYLNSFLLFATKNSRGEQDFFFLLMVCNILVIWCEQLTHWKSPWCWERLRAEGKEGVRGWDGWMASPMQWIWIWANFRRWWGTERPGMLQSMGSQKARHD